MAVTYSKEAREYAKQKKLALFAVDLDGRPSKDGITGRYSSDGPLDPRLARALFFFCLKLADCESAKPADVFKEFFPGGKPAPIPNPKKRKV